MADDANSQALGEFLRSRRERLLPADVGLPPGSRRRAAGLRREEVALIANVSTTYYTFLEQGRPIRPSSQVLDALAGALRLTPAERRYLETLASSPAAGNAATMRTAPETLDPAVVSLVDRLDPFPTYVKGRRWDVLAANAAARELFTDWHTVGESNLVAWMFTTERAREVYLDWEAEAAAMLGRFRLTAARYRGDPGFTELIERLRRDSPHVREWWPRHDVVAVGGSGTKKLLHPRLGPAAYSHVVLQVADNPEQTMVTFSRVTS